MTSSGGSSAASSVAPHDGGVVDAARDGQPEQNDGPAGKNDAKAVDSPLEAAKNPDGSSDAGRDGGPGADTRDGATPPDGSTPCGECLLGLTCGGGGVPDQCGVTIAPQHGKNCTVAGWCSEADRQAGMNAIYARTSDDIWAVGNSGQIGHFDGSVWTITSGVIQARSYEKAFYSSDPDKAYNDSQFTGVWASGPGDVWVTATGSGTATSSGSVPRVYLLLRGDGTHWNAVLKSVDSTFWYAGIWGTGPNDVWVAQTKHRPSNLTVPYAPSVAHWDGEAWTTYTPPEMIDGARIDSGAAKAIWGLSAKDIYLVCTGVTWHFDGTTWTDIYSGGLAIWGTSASSLWLAGDQKLLHNIGASWVQMTPPSFCGSGVWGTSDTSLWFGGCYFDGAKWTQLQTNVQAVQGPTATGALGLHRELGIVNLTPTSATSLSADVPAMVSNDVAGSGPKDVWIVGKTLQTTMNGPTNARALHYDGSTFKVFDRTSPSEFTTVAVLPGNDVWAGSDSGLWRFSGTGFEYSTGSPEGSRHQLWSPAKDAVWAVTGADASIWYFNGTTWQKLPHGLDASTIKLVSVWGTSATDIWVAGSGGITEHWNGNAWTAYDAGVSGEAVPTLVRVWGTSPTEVFVIGTNRKIYAWEGSRWTLSSTLPIEQGLVDYRACGASDVWVTLQSRYTLLNLGTFIVPELGHFDGKAWHIISSGDLELSPGYVRTWCAGPGDVWTVFGGQQIRHLQTP